MQVDVGKQRRDHRSLPGPLVTDRDDPVFQDTRLQPFLDQADDARVADPMLQEADQPFLADFIEERSDIGVQYVVHLGAGDADHQCVQRIVLAALGSESVREPEEILLVDRVQHRDRRPLDDLVLKGGNRKWALPAVRLRDIPTSGRLRPIRSPLDPSVQVLDPAIEVCLVVLPCQPIHTGRGISLECEECRPADRY